MAFQRVDNPALSNIKGFWRPNEKDVIIGFPIARWQSKARNGEQPSPFWIVRLHEQCKVQRKLSSGEVADVAAEPGDLIGVSHSAALEILGYHGGECCRITYNGKVSIGKGRFLKQFVVEVDPSVPKVAVKAGGVTVMPLIGPGAAPASAAPSSEGAHTTLDEDATNGDEIPF